MMQASDHGYLDDAALVGMLHESRLRGVLVEGEVRSGPVVVDEVVAQPATQMVFLKHHHVVEALAAQGPDEAFDIGSLPGGSWGDLDLVDPQGVHPAGEHRPVMGASVTLM